MRSSAGDPALAPEQCANAPAAPSRVIVPCGSDLPPPRPGVRHVSLPGLGIVVADDALRAAVDRRFHYPMIALALLTLPLLVIDFLYVQESHAAVGQEPGREWLRWLTIGGLTVIWIAFFIEFMVKIAIAECRI